MLHRHSVPFEWPLGLAAFIGRWVMRISISEPSASVVGRQRLLQATVRSTTSGSESFHTHLRRTCKHGITGGLTNGIEDSQPNQPSQWVDNCSNISGTVMIVLAASEPAAEGVAISESSSFESFLFFFEGSGVVTILVDCDDARICPTSLANARRVSWSALSKLLTHKDMIVSISAALLLPSSNG